MTPDINKERELAKDFILNTNRSIFLTGKAGTGKTTLLKEILSETDKNYIVAAPTGGAAINAGGMTLHSLFLLPLKSFLPIKYGNQELDIFCDNAQLVKHQKFNRAKLDLLLELDLLIIDEISMVRADIFDAIDYSLRRVRKNQLPFGGVQLLVIGDLFQLAPVVRPEVQSVLSQYYKSPYFFDALAWQRIDAVTVELQKVYRQADPTFVALLNQIRDGNKNDQLLEAINANYKSNPEYGDTITLTTHNKKADSINANELDKLESKEVVLDAKVQGRFPESAYPTLDKMVLKEGAQVMFIRNHGEELYYNGLIGTITEIKEAYIKVKPTDGDSIIVEPIDWKNMRYVVEEESGKIVQEELGSFHQYPLRLAWAVTVHKSQGLTFDKVILDLEGTFASGQLYVALSRCRSLEGMTLSSKISARNIIQDTRVQSFTKAQKLDENIYAELEKEKAAYDDFRLQKAFNLDKIEANLDAWRDIVIDRDIPAKADCLTLLRDLDESYLKLAKVSRNFKSKLSGHLSNAQLEEGFVEERVGKAIDYFTEQCYESFLQPIMKHCAEFSVKGKTKTYLAEVESVEIAIWKIIEKLYNLEYRGKKVYTQPPKYKFVKTTKKKKKKAVKGETYTITLKMHKEGKSVVAIAKDRGLAVGTIESHMSRLIKEQKISIYDLMTDKRVEKALGIAEAYVDLDSVELIKKMPFKMTFGELRWVTTYRSIAH